MRRSIGVDIGRTSVKVAVLTHSGGEKELSHFLNCKFENGILPAGVVDIIKGNLSGGGRVISSVPAEETIFRTALLPFRSEGKIKEIVRFEAERYLPFPVEEAIVDSYIAGYVGERDCRVMLVCIRKRLFEKNMSLLREAGVEPEVVDVDLAAVLNLMKADEGTFALVDMGEEVTSTGVVSNGKILSLRSIRVGGKDLTDALSERWGIGYDEAETKKIDEGISSYEGMIEPSCLRAPLERIAGDIGYCIKAFELNEKDKKVGKLFLSGGASRLKNVSAFLEGKLGIETSYVDALSGLELRDEETLLSRVPGNGDVAIGLALRAGRGSCGKVALNFKKVWGEKRKVRKGVFHAVLFITISFIVSVLSVFFQLEMKRSRILRLEKDIKLTFRKMFPEQHRTPGSAIEMISILNNQIEEGKARLRALGELGTDSTLEVLRGLSVEIGDSQGTGITDIFIDGTVLTVRGEASFPRYEQLKNKLSKSDFFSEFHVEKADSSAGKVKFQLSLKR